MAVFVGAWSAVELGASSGTGGLSVVERDVGETNRASHPPIGLSGLRRLGSVGAISENLLYRYIACFGGGIFLVNEIPDLYILCVAVAPGTIFAKVDYCELEFFYPSRLMLLAGYCVVTNLWPQVLQRVVTHK